MFPRPSRLMPARRNQFSKGVILLLVLTLGLVFRIGVTLDDNEYSRAALATSTGADKSEPYFAESVRNFEDKLKFRLSAVKNRRERGQVLDEVVYSIQSRLDSSACNAQLVREVIASALSLRKFCIRCDFEITLIADDPIYSYLVGKTVHNVTIGVFDRIVKSEPFVSTIFAAKKPSDLLLYPQRPFVIFMDADIRSNHRAFPEAIFDMLHKEYDFVSPIDWAHRHGELWGRGVPGLCTCLIGFINAPSVRKLLEKWRDKLESWEAGDPERKRMEMDLMQMHKDDYQLRDQEILSLILRQNTFPDVKLFPLTFEWVCPESRNRKTLWAEGTMKGIEGDIRRLTSNPCKSLHSHGIDETEFDVFPYRNWVLNLKRIGLGMDDNAHCGGAPKKGKVR